MPFENNGHPNGLLLTAYIIGLVSGMWQCSVLHKEEEKYFLALCEAAEIFNPSFPLQLLISLFTGSYASASKSKNI